MNQCVIDDTTFVPQTVEEMKEQLAISEQQIDNGLFVTADDAIKHFYQL
jgi:hypothetical protein